MVVQAGAASNPSKMSKWDCLRVVVVVLMVPAESHHENEQTGLFKSGGGGADGASREPSRKREEGTLGTTS